VRNYAIFVHHLIILCYRSLHGRVLCRLDIEPSVARSVKLKVFSQGNLNGGPCKARDPLLRLTHVLNTHLVLGFFIWQMFTLRFTVTIEIYNTLDGVSTEFA
jgi:hypothetical protein